MPPPCQYLTTAATTVLSIYWNTAARAATRKGVVYGDRANVLASNASRWRSEACTGGAGVCGKPAGCGRCPDALTGAMIALACTAREAGGVKNDRICDLIGDGLFTCMTNVNFDGQAVTAL